MTTEQMDWQDAQRSKPQRGEPEAWDAVERLRETARLELAEMEGEIADLMSQRQAINERVKRLRVEHTRLSRMLAASRPVGERSRKRQPTTAPKPGKRPRKGSATLPVAVTVNGELVPQPIDGGE